MSDSGLYEILPLPAGVDERGAAVFPFENLPGQAQRAKKLHMATIRPGHIRGNHLHPLHDEYIVALGPDVEFSLRGPDGREETVSTGPEPFFMKINRGVAHAVVNRGVADCFLTCWYSGEAAEVIAERETVLE